jgi:hypothetical protein
MHDVQRFSAWLHQRQYPADCGSTVGSFQRQGYFWGLGFGAQLVSVKFGFLEALSRGEVYHLPTSHYTNPISCPSRSLDCYLLPASNCTRETHRKAREAGIRWCSDVDEQKLGDMAGLSNKHPKEWFHAQLAGFIFRPNQRLLSLMTELTATLEQSDPLSNESRTVAAAAAEAARAPRDRKDPAKVGRVQGQRSRQGARFRPVGGSGPTRRRTLETSARDGVSFGDANAHPSALSGRRLQPTRKGMLEPSARDGVPTGDAVDAHSSGLSGRRLQPIRGRMLEPSARDGVSIGDAVDAPSSGLASRRLQNSTCVAIHIRRTDKFGTHRKEDHMPPRSFPEYAHLFRGWAYWRQTLPTFRLQLLLGSEDKTSYAQFPPLVAPTVTYWVPPRYFVMDMSEGKQFVSINQGNSRLGQLYDIMSARAAERNMSAAALAAAQAGDPEAAGLLKDEGMVLLAQMLMMSHCQAFFGSYASNVAVMVHDLMGHRRLLDGLPLIAHDVNGRSYCGCGASFCMMLERKAVRDPTKQLKEIIDAFRA